MHDSNDCIIYQRSIKTNLGKLKLLGSNTALKAILWPGQAIDWLSRNESNTLLDRTAEELSEYFDGKRTEFNIPIIPEGTEFQKQVWQALLKIPFGFTTSYGALAKQLQKPGGARAVGAALNKNPLSIIVPCHRVIGADGSLTGFAGGLRRKHWLLSHEKRFPIE